MVQALEEGLRRRIGRAQHDGSFVAEGTTDPPLCARDARPADAFVIAGVEQRNVRMRTDDDVGAAKHGIGANRRQPPANERHLVTRHESRRAQIQQNRGSFLETRFRLV